MIPIFRIIANSKDVTDRIRDRLLSLRVTDKAGNESDSCEIHLDDRDHLIELPAHGAVLDVALGYEETGLTRMGRYTVDEVEISGPPDSVKIRATSADMRTSLKSCRIREWHDTNMLDLVTTIAKTHGLTPRVGEFLQTIDIPHLDQTYESDLHLLTRLAKQYDAVAKPAGGYLLFVPRGEAKSATGQSITTIALTPGDVTSWRVTMANRGNYSRVIAHYHDKDAAEVVYIEAGSGDPAFCLRNSFPDEETARKAAHAKLDRLTRGTETLSLSAPGDPRLAAETTVRLSGFRSGANGDWTATGATHELSGGGYRTTVDCEDKL